MAQFYTLEEAARVLGMNPDELKAKAQQREVRAFMDGGSWRFRVVDVDELARRRGLGSDAELRLSDLDMPVSTSDVGDDLDLSEFQIGVAKPDLGANTIDLPKSDSSSDHDILLDDLSLPPDPMNASSSVIIGMHSTTAKMPSDSDVRLVPDNPKSGPRPSDSDVRLATPQDFKKASDSDVTLIAEDTTEHRPLGSADTAIRPSPFSGSSMEVPAAEPPESDSDFELSPSSGVLDALQPDSGSDFELTALEEASDEFDSTPMLKPGDSDVTAADPGFSGINLSRPSDSGINLQMAPGLGLGGGASSIELAPLSGDDIKVPPAPKASKPAKPSMAETPVPVKGKAEKDIFDDTDFEVDALSSDMDSDDKTVQLEAASDFELEEGEDTGSEVFAIDEEDVDTSAATALGPAVLEEDEGGEEDGFEEATSGEMGSAWDVESETPSSSAGRSAAAGPVLAPAGASAEWGGLWVGMLGVATLFMLFLAFVSMDLVRNLYDFQGDSPASGLVKSLAGLVGGGG